MLILTRRSGETVHIGDDVAVTVVAVKGHQVRIGIQAPRSVAVDREEIFGRRRTDLEIRLPKVPQSDAGGADTTDES